MIDRDDEDDQDDAGFPERTVALRSENHQHVRFYVCSYNAEGARVGVIADATGTNEDDPLAQGPQASVREAYSFVRGFFDALARWCAQGRPDALPEELAHCRVDALQIRAKFEMRRQQGKVDAAVDECA